VIIDVPGPVAPYVAAGIRQLARQLARDGCPVPPDLLALADTLMRDGGVTADQRRRAASARRSARYRARQRERRAQAETRRLSA
jgi:hypothetical protein